MTKADILRGIAKLRAGMSEYGHTGPLYVAFAGYWWVNGKRLCRIAEIEEEEWDNQQEAPSGNSDGD
jgi:hypothetical protein